MEGENAGGREASIEVGFKRDLEPVRYYRLEEEIGCSQRMGKNGKVPLYRGGK